LVMGILCDIVKNGVDHMTEVFKIQVMNYYNIRNAFYKSRFLSLKV